MNKAVCRKSLFQSASAVFWALCGDAGEILWAVTDSWKATRAWRTGHWLLQLLSGALHAGIAGSGRLVGRRDGAGEVETEGVVVTWCRSAAAFHLKLFLKLFSEMWEVWMCHGGLRVCVCFLSSEAWASLLHRSCMCIYCVGVCVCVCVGGYVPAHTHVLKWACGKSPSEQMLETACSCPSSSRRLEAAAGIKVMIHLRRKSCHPTPPHRSTPLNPQPPTPPRHTSTAAPQKLYIYIQYTSCSSFWVYACVCVCLFLTIKTHHWEDPILTLVHLFPHVCVDRYLKQLYCNNNVCKNTRIVVQEERTRWCIPSATNRFKGKIQHIGIWIVCTSTYLIIVHTF